MAPAAAVLAAGVCAALHVGKLAPAVAALQAALGLTLVQAGFALSLVQLAGMTLGLALGALTDGLGARRSIALGLAILAAASAAGGAATGVAALLLLRAVEGLGFLFVVLPAPGLLRRVVPPASAGGVLGWWGAYMPMATALALLLGPLVLHAVGWRGWWWGLALLTLAMAIVFWRVVSPTAGAAVGKISPSPTTVAPHAMATVSWASRVRRTLGASGPWLVAMTFAAYSGQWLAVIGFLPSIYAQAGIGAASTGVLTALAAGVNMLGNIASGRLLLRGVAPGVLLATGFGAMAVGAVFTFAAESAPAALRYAAVLLFSGIGGLIPATLFALAVRLAPGEHLVGTTVGWVQQWSAFGQFAGPPLVAALASSAGGWQFTGYATAACAACGLLLTALIVRRLPPPAARTPGP
jgi:MFS transporter, CP family, cyanate transporter